MKRINVKLLASLGVTVLVLGVGSYVLRAYQLDWNADTFKAQAEEAVKAAELKKDKPEQVSELYSKAIQLYETYLKYRPDDALAYEAESKLLFEKLKGADVTRQDVSAALTFNETAVRKHPELSEVRRRQIDLLMQIGKPEDALNHIEPLRKADSKDPSLELKYALCKLRLNFTDEAFKVLTGLVGYDENSDSFDLKAARGPKEVDAYRALAGILRLKRDRPASADKAIDQMVAVNASSSSAYLTRAFYRQQYQTADSAKEDFDQALKMDPDSADVVAQWALFAVNQRRFDEARERLLHALKKDPKQPLLYSLLAHAHVRQGEVKQAIAALRDGLKAVPGNPKLLEDLGDNLLEANDLEGVRSTLAEMEQRRLAPASIRYFAGCLLFKERKWRDAQKALEEVRPQFAQVPLRQAQIDLSLGGCYQAMGQPDKALAAYSEVLNVRPDSGLAILGKATSLERLGKAKEAQQMRSKLQDVVTKRGGKSLTLAASELDRAIAKQRELPEEKRDWREVERMVQGLFADKEFNVSASQKTLIQAQVFSAKGQHGEARKLLADALRQTPKDIALWATLVSVVQQEPRGQQEKTQETFQILDLAEKDLGDVLALRQLRAENVALSVRFGVSKEVAAKELAKLEEGLEKFPATSVDVFRSQMAGTYYRIRDYANARRCWKVLAEKRPEDAAIAKTLFDAAKDFGQIDDMLAESQNVKRIDGDESPTWKYARAAVLIAQVRKRQKELTALAEARDLLEDAASKRNTWYEAPLLLAEIDEIENKAKEAIVHYRRALDLGPGNVLLRQRLARLMFATGDVKGAEEQLAMVDPDKLSKDAQRMHWQIEELKGNVTDAVAAARDAVEHDPENADNHLWYGRTLANAGKVQEAEAALRAATRAGPKLPITWLTLIHFLLQAKKPDDARKVMAEAETALEEVDGSLVLAQAYEMLGDNAQAEKKYLALAKAKPDKLLIARTMVIFYTRNKRSAEARPYLEKILAAKVKPGDPDFEHLAWGRRERAMQMAASGSHGDVQQALALIAKNAVGDKLSPDDVHVQAMLLARRPDRASRDRAIELLIQQRTTGTLTTDEKLLLAQLLDRAGRWTEARDQMQNLLATTNNDLRMVAVFAGMLVGHDEMAAVAPWIARLEQAAPESLATLQLKAQVLHMQNRSEEFKAILQQIVAKKVSRAELPLLASTAGLLASLGELDAAERLLRDYVKAEPKGSLALAAFVGKYGSLDDALQLCEQGRRSQPVTEVSRVALMAIRAHSAKASKADFAKVEGWIKAAMEDEPDDISLLLALADLRELEGRAADAVQLYRKVLASRKASPAQLANSQNNLAFTLSVSGNAGQAAEAARLVAQAERYYGPVADLLDTRGMVQLAAGDTERAIADLTAAAADSPTGVKYLHLALAEQKAGNRLNAVNALKKAKEVKDEKLNPQALPPAERQMYRTLSDDLGVK